jgi:hypothetical protein
MVGVDERIYSVVVVVYLTGSYKYEIHQIN